MFLAKIGALKFDPTNYISQHHLPTYTHTHTHTHTHNAKGKQRQKRLNQKIFKEAYFINKECK